MRDDRDGVSTDHVQSSVQWNKNIVEVKIIEDEDQNSCFLKQGSESLRKSTSQQQLFFEKICGVDELFANDSLDPLIDHSNISSSNHPPQPNHFQLRASVSEVIAVSPVIEEISRENVDSDTTSDISEIPDEYRQTRDEDMEKPGCDNVLIQESNVEPKLSSPQPEEYEEDCFSTSSSTSTYESKESSYNSHLPDSDSRSSFSSLENNYNAADDNFEKQNSPDECSLNNKETKTSCASFRIEGNFDSRDIREEIKVEFERQHKYLTRELVKKSPEDSGFESFQQSSVEQNSNQGSDDEDVVATFSTVMEAENESALEEDDHATFTTIVKKESTPTGRLFLESEEIRNRARKLREESITQLGLMSLSERSMRCPVKYTRSCDMVSPVTVSTANQSTEPSYSTLSTTCQNFTNQVCAINEGSLINFQSHFFRNRLRRKVYQRINSTILSDLYQVNL